MQDRGWRIQRPFLYHRSSILYPQFGFYPRSSILDPQFRGHLLHRALCELGVDQSLDSFEAAGVLLVEPGSAERVEFLVEKRLTNTRNLLGPDFEAKPIGGLIRAGPVEESAPAERRRQKDEPTAGDGQHWPDPAVQVG